MLPSIIASALLGFLLPLVGAFVPQTFSPSLSPIQRLRSRSAVPRRPHSVLMQVPEVPVDLEGRLDPSRSWTIELNYDGDIETVEVPEGTSVLEAAETVWEDPPCDCRNGVCTSCAGRIVGGKLGEAYVINRDSLEEVTKDKGYVLTCQTYVCGPGLKVELNKNEEVYGMQYGRFEYGQS